jgi:mono/diheme cytochrome c family protein
MIWVVLLWWAGIGGSPQQVQRGETVFLEPSQGCASCHALKGQGVAVGPDLSVIGRLGPRAIATGVRSTITQYVELVSLKSGESFPGMPVSSDESCLKFYDLSKTPPALRRIERADLKTTGPQSTWKHPPAVGNLTDQQIADVIAYIRYEVTGDITPVDPGDVE